MTSERRPAGTRTVGPGVVPSKPHFGMQTPSAGLPRVLAGVHDEDGVAVRHPVVGRQVGRDRQRALEALVELLLDEVVATPVVAAGRAREHDAEHDAGDQRDGKRAAQPTTETAESSALPR